MEATEADDELRRVEDIDDDEDDDEVKMEETTNPIQLGDLAALLSVETGPLAVLEFHRRVERPTFEWFVHKMTSAREEGGAELLVKEVTPSGAVDAAPGDVDGSAPAKSADRGYVVVVAAYVRRLLEGAEDMDLKKQTLDKSLHAFRFSDLKDFLVPSTSGDPANILTTAEMGRICLHELENIRALKTDFHVEGYVKRHIKKKIKLTRGESILKRLIKSDLILNLYPLHEPETLKRMESEWYGNVFGSHPVNIVRDYFGEKIAIYFSFLGFYTVSLIPPATIGILYSFSEWDDVYKHALFSIFNLVWVTLFLEVWKRRSNELAYSWGTLENREFEEPRPTFKGKEGVNPVTGKSEPLYPWWKRMMKVYLGSIPVVLVCLQVAFKTMLIFFYYHKAAEQEYEENPSMLTTPLLFLPSAVYATAIGILNQFYREIAKSLTEWENHRLQSTHENFLITKLIVFESVNGFGSLFYIAFWDRDLDTLCRHLATIMITKQILGHVKEALVPYAILLAKNNQFFGLKLRKSESEGEDATPPGRDESATRPSISSSTSASTSSSTKLSSFLSAGVGVGETLGDQVRIERGMVPYEGTFDDYLELFLQFGYVFLFSSVYPLAAFWAFLNNVLEMKSDGFKLCRVCRRPFAQSASSIGAWQTAFEILGIVGVMTNTGLLALNVRTSSLLPPMSPSTHVLVFVAFEHLVVVAKCVVAFAIPDVPDAVAKALARTEFQSRRALRKERVKKRINDRFETVARTKSGSKFVASSSTIIFRSSSLAARPPPKKRPPIPNFCPPPTTPKNE